MANNRNRNRNRNRQRQQSPAASTVVQVPKYAATDLEPALANLTHDGDTDEPQIKDFSELMPAETMAIYVQAMALAEDLKPIQGIVKNNNVDINNLAPMQSAISKAQNMIITNAENPDDMRNYLKQSDLNTGLEFIFKKFAEMMDSLGN